jgi:GAF domain-containing protein
VGLIRVTVTTAHDDALDILSGMAVSLRHEIDLDFVLAELATGVRHTLDAERVSVLLLDDDGRLIPAVAVARQHNDELWQRFRKMPPIALDEIPGARQALAQGKVLLIEDASSSSLIPTAWQRTFSLGSLAVAPLVVEDAPAGLVAVEYDEIDATCTPTQLALLEGMAALAAVALRAGRHRSQQQRLEVLSSTVARFAGMRTPRAVAEHALTALLDSAHLTTGLFALLTNDTAEVVAVRGPQLTEPGRYALSALPDDLVTACRQAWRDGARAPVSADLDGRGLDGRGLLLLPVGERPAAVVVLPLLPGLLAPDVLGELQLIASAAAVQLRSARLEEEREWHQRALSLLSSAPRHVDTASFVRFVDDVCSLLSDAGLPAPAVAVDRSVARVTGLAPARTEVARLISRWRRTGGASTARAGENTVIPLRTGDRVVGGLVTAALSPPSLPPRAELLIAVLGDVIGRAVSLEHTDELELRAADSAAHTAVASRAYREAGQLLGLLANSLHAGAAESPRSAGAEVLVAQVRRLLRDATEVLAPSAAPQADLRVSLTALAKQICAHGGPECVVREIGPTGVLDPAVQVAVVRAVQRLLALLRELRAVAAFILIERSDGDVVVTVRTDELLAAAGEGPGLLATRRDVRTWLDPVGGRLETSSDGPGQCLVVRAPVRAPELASKSGDQATSAQIGQRL